jgi:hypothetical protein
VQAAKIRNNPHTLYNFRRKVFIWFSYFATVKRF